MNYVKHQISMCKTIVTQSSASTVPHTVAMRNMTSSYQCMLYVSFIHKADILSIAASATTNQLDSVHDAISFSVPVLHAILADHLTTISHSVLNADNQVSQQALCNDCRYRTEYGHDGWRYREGVHANREYGTCDVSTVAPAATSITAQSGCFQSIASPRAVRPFCSTSFTTIHHTCTHHEPYHQ